MRLILALGGLIGVLAAIFVVGDLPAAARILSHASWNLSFALLAATAVGYTARYIRWHALLVVLSANGAQHRLTFLSFAAGSLLIFTPARTGEAAKCVYARRLLGIPVARSLPVLIAERINDVVVMALLGAAGVAWVGSIGDQPLLTTAAPAALAGLGVIVLASRSRPARVLWSTHAPGAAKRFLAAFVESGRELLAARALLLNLWTGIGAWIAEVLIYFLALLMVGQPTEPGTLAMAMAVYPLASLAGALSMLPAGLGATEGGLVGLGVALGGLQVEEAAAAALLARVAVLGSVVVIGAIATAYAAHLPGKMGVGEIEATSAPNCTASREEGP